MDREVVLNMVLSRLDAIELGHRELVKFNDAKIHQLEFAMMNNYERQTARLEADVAALTAKVSKLERIIWIAVGVCTAAGTALSYVFKFIMES